MNFSRPLSLLGLGLAILITVPLKLSDFEAIQKRISNNLEQATAALLSHEGFEVEVENRVGTFVINAQANDCHLQIREARTEGFNTDAIRATAPTGAQFVFEYGGKLSTSQPKFSATILKFWNRVKWQIGMSDVWSPVISIAAVGPCALETLGWNELANIRTN